MKITYRGIDFEVEYEYQPEEPEERYDSNNTGYPGCAEEFYVTKVTHKGTDFTKFFADEWEEFDEAAYEFFKRQGEDY